MSDRPRLGEILVSAGIIDEMQLTSALGEQSRWGRRLGVTLIKLGDHERRANHYRYGPTKFIPTLHEYVLIFKGQAS